MSAPATSAHSGGTCGSCGGRGTVQVDIYNTATNRWQTLTQTCLNCNGSGRS